jgi:hypothetical protein
LLCPITFTNNQGIDVASRQATTNFSIANAIINQDTGAILKYFHLIQDETTFLVWTKSAANEFGRLTQGVAGRIKGYKTILFNPRQAVPKGKIVTYGHFVVDIRPKKTETHQVRLTGGGNLIQYPGDVSTPSADPPLQSASGIALFPLKALSICVWMSRTFTLVPQWTHLSTCASQSKSSLRRQLQNKTFSLWYQMDIYMLKCKKACMACPMPASSPTNYLHVA